MERVTSKNPYEHFFYFTEFWPHSHLSVFDPGEGTLHYGPQGKQPTEHVEDLVGRGQYWSLQ
jgi:hypothetical protein